MPESFITALEDRCFALESFIEHTSHDTSSVIIRNMSYGRSQAAIADADRLNAAIFPSKKTRGKRARSSDDSDDVAASQYHTTNKQQVGSPRKGSSRHYGVRFRPDLRKWVAEIRVAQWKDVDKKVWLGTFEEEDCAAHGVDVARKLLRCTKKRPFNLPCPELDRYHTTIPEHMDLTDLANDAMFKDVVAFIKNECQTYAAGFSQTTTVPPVASQIDNYPEEVDVFWKNYDSFELSLPSPSINVTDFDILDAELAPFDGYSTSSEPSSFTGQEFRYHSVQQQQAAAAAAAWEMAVDLGVDSLGVESTSLAVEPVCHDNLAAAYSLPQTWPGSRTLNSGLGAEHSPLYVGGDMTFFDQFQMDMN